MNIVVIDAQGGGMGKTVIEAIKKNYPDQHVTCIGTNGMATANMMKAGADQAATGENAICVSARTADLIICPIGLLLCDAMLGEVTGKMVKAIGRSNAVRILIPSNRCATYIAGYQPVSLQETIRDILEKVRSMIEV